MFKSGTDSLQIFIVRLMWARHVARMEKVRSAFKISTDKHTVKRPLGESRHKWEDNIRMDLKEIVSTRNLINSTQDRGL